jgi:NitT/TauT family transport system substrate-binding protein
MTLRRSTFIICGICLSLLAPAQVWSLDFVRVALPTIACGNVFLIIAQEKGFYQQEGIDASFEVASPIVGVQALLAGDYQFTGSGVAAILASLRGAPVKLVFVQIPVVTWWLFASPDVTSINALKGKTIGIEGPGTLSDVLTRVVLKARGLEPDRDVTFVGIGPVSNWYGSLRGRTVTAAIVDDPALYIRAKREGFRELLFYGQYVHGMLYNLATSDRLLREKPDLVRRFLRASLKGLRLFLSDEPTAVAAIQRIYKNSPADAEQAYHMALRYYSPQAEADEMTVQAMVATVAQVLNLKGPLPPPSHFYDFSILNQIVGN